MPQTLLAGGMAGAAACLVVYPFTSLAGQMSVAGGVQGSIFQVSKQIYKTFGICLLYTSPSPRDPKTPRMPSSA